MEKRFVRMIVTEDDITSGLMAHKKSIKSEQIEKKNRLEIL